MTISARDELELLQMTSKLDTLDSAPARIVRSHMSYRG